MTNKKFEQELSNYFDLAARLTPEEAAQLSIAGDNVIMHYINIALNAREAITPDMVLTPQEIQECEQGAMELNAPEIYKLIDGLNMYVPNIPYTALIAAMYVYNDYIPPDTDGYTEDDGQDFIEAEHGKETGDYASLLTGISIGDERPDWASDEMWGIATKAAMALELFHNIDLPEGIDFGQHIRGLRLDALDNALERLLLLKHIAGDLGDPLETMFEDQRDEIDEAIIDYTRCVIDQTNYPAMSPQSQLPKPPKNGL